MTYKLLPCPVLKFHVMVRKVTRMGVKKASFKLQERDKHFFCSTSLSRKHQEKNIKTVAFLVMSSEFQC